MFTNNTCFHMVGHCGLTEQNVASLTQPIVCMSLCSYNLTCTGKTEAFYVLCVVFPAHMVAMVTDDEALLHIDIDRGMIGCSFLSFLMRAGFVVTCKSLVNVMILCTASQGEVTGV